MFKEKVDCKYCRELLELLNRQQLLELLNRQMGIISRQGRSLRELREDDEALKRMFRR